MLSDSKISGIIFSSTVDGKTGVAEISKFLDNMNVQHGIFSGKNRRIRNFKVYSTMKNTKQTSKKHLKRINYHYSLPQKRLAWELTNQTLDTQYITHCLHHSNLFTKKREEREETRRMQTAI